MELMTWTDGKLEERLARINDRFDHVDEAVVAVKSEVGELSHELKGLRKEIKDELRELRGEIKSEIRELREDLLEIRKSIETTHLLMHRDRQGLLVALIALIGAILVRGA